jgi:hypothetical protein
VDDSGSCQEQDNDNQGWYDRPSQLNLRASVYLSRLAAGIQCSPTELNDGIDQQDKDNEKDDSGDGEYKD